MEPPSLDDAILSYIKDYCQSSSSEVLQQTMSVPKKQIQKHYDSIVDEYDTSKKNVKHALKRLIKRDLIVKDGKKKYSYIQPQQQQSSRDICTVIETDKTNKRKRPSEERNVDVSTSTIKPTIVKKRYIYTCTHEGCNNRVVNGGLCVKHGAKRLICKHEGCNNQCTVGGLCIKHGAKKYTCSHDGCTNQIISRGVCIKHGAKRRTCSHKGCDKWSLQGGVCTKHGAIRPPRKKCEREDCNNNAVRLGVCRRHGAYA